MNRMMTLKPSLVLGLALAASLATGRPARANEADDACVDGIVSLDKGDAREALTHFTRAIQLDPRNAVAYAYRARAYADLKMLAPAYRDCLTALRLDNQLAKAFHHRGVVLHLAGKRKDALRDYNTALRLDSQDAQAYNDRGTARLELGDVRGSLADFDKAIELQPTLAEAYGNRACAKVVLGMADESRDDFAECFKLEPKLRPYFEKQIVQFQRYFKLRKAIMGQIRDLVGGLAD